MAVEAVDYLKKEKQEESVEVVQTPEILEKEKTITTGDVFPYDYSNNNHFMDVLSDLSVLYRMEQKYKGLIYEQ